MEFDRIREPLIRIAMQINEEVLLVISVYVNFASRWFLIQKLNIEKTINKIAFLEIFLLRKH